METPRYKHFRCDSCRFLGSMQCGGTWIDMFQCRSMIVLRWSDEPETDRNFGDDYIGRHTHVGFETESEGDVAWWPAYLEAWRRSRFLDQRRLRQCK